VSDVFDQLERELVRAAGRRAVPARPTRRRALLAAAIALAVLLTVSAAWAISGEGPLADLLGGRRDDPNLRFAKPTPGGERAVVVAESESGQRWRFAIFQSDQPLDFPDRPRARGTFCFTPVQEAANRTSGLGCGAPAALREQIRARGLYFTPYGSGSHGETSGVLAISPVWGLVPATALAVRVSAEGEPPIEATLSEPFALGVKGGRRSPDTRAFLAVVDLPGDLRLRGFNRVTAEVRLADGTTRSRSREVAVGFPLVGASRPRRGAKRIRQPAEVGSWRWQTVAYEGRDGSLCTSAAPLGEELIKLTRIQCSGPLAIIDAFHRFGVATYPSDTNPLGGGKLPGSYVVRGFARTDAREVVVVDQRGRRWRAALTEPWTTVARRSNDTANLKGRFRERFGRLPRSARVRNFAVAIRTPPGPRDGRGLSVRTRLSDGSTLVQP
jgi:hypothetical protein